MNNKDLQPNDLPKPDLHKANVGSSSIKKFRRGKKFQDAYFDIGMTNQKIQSLKIEAESFDLIGNLLEAESRRELAEKFRNEIVGKYDSETFDLDYIIPQTSGLYVKQGRSGVL